MNADTLVPFKTYEGCKALVDPVAVTHLVEYPVPPDRYQTGMYLTSGEEVRVWGTMDETARKLSE